MSQMRLEVADETVFIFIFEVRTHACNVASYSGLADGICGIHAFATVLIDVAQRDRFLSSTSQFKQVMRLRNDLKG